MASIRKKNNNSYEIRVSLGHLSSNTILGIYIHEFQEAQARTSDIIAEALNFEKKNLPFHSARH